MDKDTHGWTMPSWMEPYRAYLPDGKRAEELVNTTGEQANVFNNAPLALICVDMKARISTLETLYHAGFLKETPDDR